MLPNSWNRWGKAAALLTREKSIPAVTVPGLLSQIRRGDQLLVMLFRHRGHFTAEEAGLLRAAARTPTACLNFVARASAASLHRATDKRSVEVNLSAHDDIELVIEMDCSCLMLYSFGYLLGFTYAHGMPELMTL
jgi:hypothetical protein